MVHSEKSVRLHNPWCTYATMPDLPPSELGIWSRRIRFDFRGVHYDVGACYWCKGTVQFKRMIEEAIGLTVVRESDMPELPWLPRKRIRSILAETEPIFQSEQFSNNKYWVKRDILRQILPRPLCLMCGRKCGWDATPAENVLLWYPDSHPVPMLRVQPDQFVHRRCEQSCLARNEEMRGKYWQLLSEWVERERAAKKLRRLYGKLTKAKLDDREALQSLKKEFEQAASSLPS